MALLTVIVRSGVVFILSFNVMFNLALWGAV